MILTEYAVKYNVTNANKCKLSLISLAISMRADVTGSKFHTSLLLLLPSQYLLLHRLGWPGAVGPRTQDQSCCWYINKRECR